jgi:hypothetical protein
MASTRWTGCHPPKIYYHTGGSLSKPPIFAACLPPLHRSRKKDSLYIYLNNVSRSVQAPCGLVHSRDNELFSEVCCLGSKYKPPPQPSAERRLIDRRTTTSEANETDANACAPSGTQIKD